MPPRSQFQGAAAGFKSSLLPYVGPGDLVAEAAAWWGLRAYSNATAGTTSARLRRDSDNAESDFSTLSDGTLDVAGIATWASGANLFVVKLYDKIGTNDAAQATAANQPPFALNALGSRPMMQLVAASQHNLVTGSNLTASEPVTFSAVASYNVGATNYNTIMCSYGGSTPTILELDFRGLTFDKIYMQENSASSEIAAANSTYYAIQAVFNNPNSDLNVDGTAHAWNPGVAASASGPVGIGFAPVGAGTQFMYGNISEAGVWLAAFTGTQSTNMSANQHSYWGF